MSLHSLLRRLEVRFYDVMMLLCVLAAMLSESKLFEGIFMGIAFVYFVRSLLTLYGKTSLRVCDICFKNIVAVNAKVEHENKN